MFFRPVAIALLFVASPSYAAMSPEDCATLAVSVGKASAGVDGLRRSAETTNLSSIKNAGTQSVAAAVNKVDSARDAMVPAIKAYVAALQDLGYELNLCSR